MASVPQTQARNRFKTFREVCEDPPPSCSIVICNLVGTPKRRRHKFATALMELSEETGKKYSGYVMRREREYIEVVIVVPSTTEEQLADLYQLLVEFDVDNESFVFEETNYLEYHRLRQPFRVIVRQGSEPNFSDDIGGIRSYEVASSINSHASSGIY